MSFLKRVLAPALAVAVLPVAAANAATIVIDDFLTAQTVVSKPGPGQVARSEIRAIAASEVGGYREMQAINSQNRLNGTVLETGDGLLDFSNATRTSGRGILTWNGQGSAGLGGLDVTDGRTNDAVFFNVLFADASVGMTFNLTDTSGRSSIYSTVLAEGLDSESIRFGFDEFTGSADFTSINSISFTLEGQRPAVDATIDLLYFGETVAAVPVPASAALLGSVVIGLGLMARRRRTA